VGSRNHVKVFLRKPKLSRQKDSHHKFELGKLEEETSYRIEHARVIYAFPALGLYVCFAKGLSSSLTGSASKSSPD
jgi:hypothetical protein